MTRARLRSMPIPGLGFFRFVSSVSLFCMALVSIVWAKSVDVSSVGQLVNAVNNGTVGDTVMVAAGTYALTTTLAPKARMAIKGAGITSTILQPASSWNPGPANKVAPPDIAGIITTAYTFNLAGNSNITIADMTMDGLKKLHGAVCSNAANYVTIYNVYFHDFTFTGVRLASASNAAIHDCEFINMAIDGMDPEAGAIVFAYLANSEFYNNQFYFATHGVYYGTGVNAGNYFGYKGRQLRQSRIHDNTIMVNFSIELPFENDQDVEIDHNYMVGMISMPKTGDGGGTPPSGVACHIHHNYTSASQVLEYPRNCVELDHNLIDNTRFEDGGLISGWYDNSLYSGPTKVHDNLINNLGRTITDIGRYNNFQFYNNHVISTNNAGAGSVCFILATGASDIDRSSWAIKDNIFDFSAHARTLFWSGLGAGFTAIQNNTLTNVTDQANYSNPNTGAARGPLAPLSFTCGAPRNQFCVDQWTVTSCVPTHVLNENKISPRIAFRYSPANLSALISYQSIETSSMEISVHDLLGREVMQVANQPQPAGEHQLKINTKRLRNGIYVVKIDMKGERVAHELTINR